MLELTYTSHSKKPFALDLSSDGLPYAWNEPRCTTLRAERDARIARLYGLHREQRRYILDPADTHGPAAYSSETFRVLKKNEIAKHGEYRTRRLVLAAWDAEGSSDRPSGFALLVQQLHCEGPTVASWRRFQGCYGFLGLLDSVQRFSPQNLQGRIVVSFMALLLQFHENIGATLDQRRKIHVACGKAGNLCVAVLQRSVEVSPGLVGAILAHANQQVGSVFGQGVEKGVVSRADRTLQVCLTRLSWASVRQFASGDNQTLARF